MKIKNLSFEFFQLDAKVNKMCVWTNRKILYQSSVQKKQHIFHKKVILTPRTLKIYIWFQFHKKQTDKWCKNKSERKCSVLQL